MKLYDSSKICCTLNWSPSYAVTLVKTTGVSFHMLWDLEPLQMGTPEAGSGAPGITTGAP